MFTGASMSVYLIFNYELIKIKFFLMPLLVWYVCDINMNMSLNHSCSVGWVTVSWTQIKLFLRSGVHPGFHDCTDPQVNDYSYCLSQWTFQRKMNGDAISSGLTTDIHRLWASTEMFDSSVEVNDQEENGIWMNHTNLFCKL